MSLKGFVQRWVNNALRPFGVQVIRGWSTDPAILQFLSAKKIIAGAKRAGVSVGDYLDAYSAGPGATEDAVAAMLNLAQLKGPVDRVCEIGPGSGRYGEKVAAALQPDVYEIYETAKDWLPHLRETLPNLVVQPADGHTLSATESGTVDLVHAHKLFVYIPFITTAGYLDEMARVVRPGGIVAFDIITEDCVDEDVVKSWIAQNSTIYWVTPRTWTIELLKRRGLTLLGNHKQPLSEGRTELLVFRKD